MPLNARAAVHFVGLLFNVISEVMDSLRSCVAPLQEYLLQGSILDSHRDLLLHRLNGLCDYVDTGPEKFHDQELVYTLRKYFIIRYMSIYDRILCTHCHKISATVQSHKEFLDQITCLFYVCLSLALHR